MDEVRASLIIPSATLVGIDMQNEFGAIPPGLVPLSGRVVFELIVDALKAFGPLHVYIGLNQKSELVRSHFDLFPHPWISLVSLESTSSIAETVAKVMQSDPAILGRPVLVNFADTIVRTLDPGMCGTDFTCYADTDETERWTLFQSNGSAISDISDKQYQIDRTNWKTFVGLWGFSDPARFLHLIETCSESQRGGTFYSALTQYVSDCDSYKFVPCPDWTDCGHVDNYYTARRRAIAPRYFNSIATGDQANSVVKTSSNRQKLIQEIDWYLALPKELRYFVPHIYGYSTDTTSPYVEMEFYSYPSLNDCFVYARYDFDTWDKIFLRIFDVIKVAGKYRVCDSGLEERLYAMYVKKTCERLTPFHSSNPALIDRAIADNCAGPLGITNLEQLLDQLPNLVKKAGLLDAPYFQIIHGDPCFSNILYDHRHGLIKLIDPRGDFGGYSIYGDVYYDLAKLSHSVSGLYDFITADQFRVPEGQTRIESVRWGASEYHRQIGAIFAKYVVSAGFDLKRVRFAEALLFLSMLPLHQDEPRRQHVMLLRGLDLLRNFAKADL